MSSFGKKIAGAFELLLLSGRGIGAFSGTKEAAVKSFIWPAAFLPCSLATAYFYPPKGMETGYGHGQIAATVAVQYVLSLAISFALVTLIARALKRDAKIWLFFEACNWSGLAFSLVLLPFAALAIGGVLPREEMDRAFAIIDCYGYVVTGCIVWRALEVNWHIAGAIAVVTLFVNQELWHTLYSLQGIPQPW